MRKTIILLLVSMSVSVSFGASGMDKKFGLGLSGKGVGMTWWMGEKSGLFVDLAMEPSGTSDAKTINILYTKKLQQNENVRLLLQTGASVNIPQADADADMGIFLGFGPEVILNSMPQLGFGAVGGLTFMPQGSGEPLIYIGTSPYIGFRVMYYFE